jgi:predicted site-specific integrase-resolvase
MVRYTMDDKFVGGKQASAMLGVHQRTLYQWEAKKFIETIRTPGGKRLYNVSKYLRENRKQIDRSLLTDLGKLNDTMDTNERAKLNLSYVRVSSTGQKDDLIRQKKAIIEKYPDHIMIEDVGSGMNLNKRGIRKIIKLAIAGRINELVVAYKDRLARFGYELIEDRIKEYSGGKIIVMNKKDNVKPEEELAYDVLQIMNVYVAKMNGLRKYRKMKKEDNVKDEKGSKK